VALVTFDSPTLFVVIVQTQITLETLYAEVDHIFLGILPN
jgi:hypothetical protein